MSPRRSRARVRRPANGQSPPAPPEPATRQITANTCTLRGRHRSVPPFVFVPALATTSEPARSHRKPQKTHRRGSVFDRYQINFPASALCVFGRLRHHQRRLEHRTLHARFSRSQLISGAWRGKADPIRPPWSLPEDRFTALCSTCGDCVDACPSSILVRGRGGYPEVNFGRGTCDFCGACADACADACAEPAFGPRDGPPWQLAARFSSACLASQGITCRICAEWCDSRAIRFRLAVGGRALPEGDAAACTGCGACIAICPTQAVSLEKTA
ncbi:MAG: ferredoxin-type protein NapF [Rhodospirillales bacterium]|nr:MAG: ferredoxin-type protein NapF [Rhodospirillales bacterium]